MGKNGHRKYLMTNLSENYVAVLGFPLMTPESAVSALPTALWTLVLSILRQDVEQPPSISPDGPRLLGTACFLQTHD